MKKTLALAAVAAAIVPATSIAAAQGAPSDAQARDATAASLTVRTTRFGKILFAGNGRALYGRA